MEKAVTKLLTTGKIFIGLKKNTSQREQMVPRKELPKATAALN